MTKLLEIENLRVRFRVVGAMRALIDGVHDPYIDAVLGVSLSLDEGTTFGLVGESGSGKTTLGRAIVGLVPAEEGTVRFNGADLTGLSDSAYKPYRRDIAIMFQDPVASLSPRRTVRALVTEPFIIHGLKDRDLDAEAGRLLGMVGLNADFCSRYPHELSGGQARRVGVARALALSPKLIIADEPTAGLDVSVQGEILNLMGELQAELGLSYLIITHNLPMVRHICDEMAIMYLGRFVEQGRTEEIFEHSTHPYTKALLSAIPRPDPDQRREVVELQGEIPSLRTRPSGCEFHTRCSYAQDVCSREFPDESSNAPGHKFVCHFPLHRIAET